MTKEKKVENFIKERTEENARRAKGDFWRIYKCRSVVSWGWVEPLEYPECKVMIVWLSFSPRKAGEEGLVIYDYVTCKEFERKT